MATSLWDQLAEREVPAPPPQFDHSVHQQLNKTLLVTHMTDLGLRGVLSAMSDFAPAVLHLMKMTLGPQKEKKESDPQ